jgi:type IV pilus assembly protein PilM
MGEKMLRLRKKKNRLLALDLGPSALKMILADPRGKSPLVEDILYREYSRPLPHLHDPEIEKFFAEELRQIMAAYLDRDLPVALPLPTQLVSRQDLQLPEMADKDLEQAIYWALKEKMEQSPDIFQRDHLVLGKVSEGGRQLLAVRVYLAKQDDVLRIESLFDGLGLRVQYLEPEEIVLTSTWQLCFPDTGSENSLVVNIGGLGTTILIISGGLPVITRRVAVSPRAWAASLALHRNLDEELARQLLREHGLSFYRHRFDKLAEGKLQEEIFTALEADMQQLALEIHRTIDYFQSTMHRGKVKHILLAGGGSQLPDLDFYLADTLEIPCDIFDPLESLDFSAFKGDPEQLASCRQHGARFAVAAGLARRD